MVAANGAGGATYGRPDGTGVVPMGVTRDSYGGPMARGRPWWEKRVGDMRAHGTATAAAAATDCTVADAGRARHSRVPTVRPPGRNPPPARTLTHCSTNTSARAHTPHIRRQPYRVVNITHIVRICRARVFVGVSIIFSFLRARECKDTLERLNGLISRARDRRPCVHVYPFNSHACTRLRMCVSTRFSIRTTTATISADFASLV